MAGRYAACHILHEKGIPATCWFEDAVKHYGVPTALFDLFLLVEDVDAAAQALLTDGWMHAAGRPNDAYAFYGDENCKPYRRLARPAKPDNHTFLLNAADWAYPAERLGRRGNELGGPGSMKTGTNINIASSITSSSPPFYPRLPHLVDALIDSILDGQRSNRVSNHLRVMITYLYGHVKEMKPASFADQLTYDHRQFHYDMEAITVFSLRFIDHERTVRQQIRDGTLVPYHDPWHKDRECLS